MFIFAQTNGGSYRSRATNFLRTVDVSGGNILCTTIAFFASGEAVVQMTTRNEHQRRAYRPACHVAVRVSGKRIRILL